MQKNSLWTCCLGNEFTARTKALVSAYQRRTTQEGFLLLFLARISLAASGIESGISYQSTFINGQWSLHFDSSPPATATDCSCSTALACPDTQWSGGQFWCQQGNNCTAGTLVWSIPGLVKSCTTFESHANHDLRCFVNQTCVDMVISMYNVDMPRRLPLPAETRAIKAIDISNTSVYTNTDTFAIIFQKMLEGWESEVSFERYYNYCAPDTCTYKYTSRWDLIYVVSTVFSLIGGLVVTFRLLIPIVAHILWWIVEEWRRRRANHDWQSNNIFCGG